MNVLPRKRFPSSNPNRQRMVASQEEQLVPDTELDTGTRM